MAVVSNQPTNKNFLSPVGFKFEIKKLPTTNFFVQSVNLPGLTLGLSSVSTPFKNIPLAGDKVEFNDLSINFKVDEDMNNWTEIFNWIIGLGFPESFEQFAALDNLSYGEGKYTDATLIILSSAMNANKSIIFQDLFPYSLSDIQLSTMDSSIDYIEATATFKFRTYTISSV